MQNPGKKPFSGKERLASFRYAFAGLKILISEEHNFLIHIVATVIAVALGFVFHINSSEWIALVVVIALVLVVETINSAIEALSDFVSPGKHPQIKKVKDLSAAAVLLSSFAAVIVGCIIFLPKFFH